MQLDGPGSIGVDAETRTHYLQAVQRRSEPKWRDSGVDRLILLVARTRHNATVLREHRVALASTFPAGTSETMAALWRGRLPRRNRRQHLGGDRGAGRLAAARLSLEIDWQVRHVRILLDDPAGSKSQRSRHSPVSPRH